jgi:Protein of unknown function (DUF1365)
VTMKTGDQTQDAAALYFGEVMHARLKPMGHRFSYRVMSLLIDLDRLEEADRRSPLFGINRAALYSFHEADHGERDGSSLRAYVRQRAAEQGIDLTGGKVLLLCYPRLLGYTFNPLSVYFCYSADGRLALMVYEVRNTFGDIHRFGRPIFRLPESARRRTSCSTSRPSWKWRCATISALRCPASRSGCASWRPTGRGPCSLQPSAGGGLRSPLPPCCVRSWRCRW